MLKTNLLNSKQKPFFISSVIVLEVFKSILFFVVLSFFGLTYEGSENSSVFIITMIFLFLFSFVVYLLYGFKEHISSFRFVLFLLVITFVIFLGAFQILIKHGFEYATMKYFFFFWIFSFNSILWGDFVGRNIQSFIPLLVKWVEVVSLMVSLSSLISIIIPVLTKNATSMYAGGVNYQTASYYSAFAFGTTLFYLIRGNASIRFTIFKSKFYKLFSIVLLFLLVFCTIAPGGRGAFVLLVCYMILGLWYFLKTKQGSQMIIIYILLALVLLPIVILLVNETIGSNSILRSGLDRALAFIDFENKSIDIKGGSSGRGPIYQQAIELISLKPYFGYGLFEYMYHLTSVGQYPHNFVLEVLLQGGFVYFFIITIVVAFSLGKLKKLKTANIEYEFLLFIILYPLVMLSFSGTYLNEPILWFCLMIVISADVSEDERA